MGLLVTVSDFKGDYELPKNDFSNTRTADIITQYEEQYLRRVLGSQLFDLFKTAYTADPTLATEPRFKAIYDPIAQDDTECGKVMMNNGMKEMMVGFMYFFVARRAPFKNTVSGTRTTVGDASANVGPTQADIYGRYNSAVGSARVIQWYIEKNIGDYPEYNGELIRIAHPYY